MAKTNKAKGSHKAIKKIHKYHCTLCDWRTMSSEKSSVQKEASSHRDIRHGQRPLPRIN